MDSVETPPTTPQNGDSVIMDAKREGPCAPPELRSVNPSVLEKYVRQRLMANMEIVREGLLVRFRSIPDSLETAHMVCNAAEDIIRRMSPVGETDPQQEEQKHKLMFRHRCLALGCMDQKCDLCEANPRRRCRTDFDKKYFKGDILKAKCSGNIFVEIVDAETEERVDARDMDVLLEMCILDGNRYDQLFPDGISPINAKSLDMCALLTGNEGRPLLQSHDRTANKTDGRVVVPLQNGVAHLPDLSVQYSSEALLSGRRPPFRLMVRIYGAGPFAPSLGASVVVPGVSDGFVVASGRSRLAQKKHIPSVDDPVSRLENMGKERVKKLKDLRETARMMGVELMDSAHCTVTKVGDFKQLAKEADKDGQLRQKMLHILKMSEKAWDETRDHAVMAVTNDTRMRAWYRQNGENVGLVYSCYLGETDLERAVALLEGEEVHLKEHLKPQQRILVRDLEKQAFECWWQPGHTGWTFYPFDSEVFKQSPSRLKSPRDIQRGTPMEIDRTDVVIGQFNSFEAIPGRPLVPVLQSVPMPGSGPDSMSREGDNISSRKRMRTDRHHGQGQNQVNVPTAILPKRPPPSPFDDPRRSKTSIADDQMKNCVISTGPTRSWERIACEPTTRPALDSGFEIANPIVQQQFEKILHRIKGRNPSFDITSGENGSDRKRDGAGRSDLSSRKLTGHALQSGHMDVAEPSATGSTQGEGSAGNGLSLALLCPTSASDRSLSIAPLPSSAREAYEEENQILQIDDSSIGATSRLAADRQWSYRTARLEGGNRMGNMHKRKGTPLMAAHAHGDGNESWISPRPVGDDSGVEGSTGSFGHPNGASKPH